MTHYFGALVPRNILLVPRNKILIKQRLIKARTSRASAQPQIFRIDRLAMLRAAMSVLNCVNLLCLTVLHSPKLWSCQANNFGLDRAFRAQS